MKLTGILTKIVVALFFCAEFACAQVDVDGTQHRENRLSWGFSLGPLSGGYGFAGRYWAEAWGVQATVFPFVYSTDEGPETFSMGGLQIMHRFQPDEPRKHEAGGYVHSMAFQYVGITSATTFGTDDSDVLLVLGGGVGIETFWRNWRLATGVGLMNFNVSNDHGILPTLDISLTYGL